MRRSTATTMLLLLPILVACKSTEPGNTDNGGSPSVERAYINFHAHWSDGSDAFVDVSIYEQFSSTRLLLASTLPNGDFYSPGTYPVDRNYDVFIHDIGSGNCIDVVLVAFGSNSPWPRSPRNTAEVEVNVGPKSPMNNLTGCRP